KGNCSPETHFQWKRILTDRKIFAIGDIHGCARQLATLLDRIPCDWERDTLIFLGDYINRGPDTKAVLDILLDLRESCADIHFLKGNHEQELLEYIASGNVDSLRALREMGVEATVESYGSRVNFLPGFGCFPAEHKEFLQSLKFFHLQDDYLFIHADINRELLSCPMNESDDRMQRRVMEAGLLSSRRLAREQTTAIDTLIVFGHIPFASPLVMADRICIDTGAVYGNMLTAVELPSVSFFHA
ncbi:MAG: metallophosphoesterase, partial [Desulforhopalus sp.]